MTKEDREFFEEIGGKLDGGFGLKYNLFCCEQGILIAEACQTKENIVDFNKLPFEKQLEMVPGLSDDHSGNTFGLSCRFAIAYIPMLLINKRDRKIDDIIG